jgi:LmbE family N-acetylglucosaminyl deacetylase
LHWVVFSASPTRAAEARASADDLLAAAGAHEVVVHGFRDSFFPSEHFRLKETMEDIRSHVEPDLIFTHCRTDHHQDHRVISELTWNAFRNHLILEYEIPKYDPDLGNPNVFVRLRPEHAEAKVAVLMHHFGTQRQRQWFTPETFYGLMRLRGIQAAAPSGFAEGFYGPKLCL